MPHITNEHVRGLKPERVQTDEIWSFNYCKQKNVATATAAPDGAGDVWTWTAIDSDHKLIISYRVGLRKQDDADQLILDLAGRITSRVQLTSDGHGTCSFVLLRDLGEACAAYHK